MNDYKKIKRAVALRYQQEKDRAPVVTAKGQGRVAEKIISLAEEHDIPVEKNSLLAYELFKLELNQEIPVELYEAVAIILTAIYQCDQKAKST